MPATFRAERRRDVIRPAVVLGLVVLAMLAIRPAPAVAGFTGPVPNAPHAAAAAPSPPQLAEPGWIGQMTGEIRRVQQGYYRKLGAGIQALKTDFSAEAAFGLIAIAFIYGIFHAAGPGHGKAVISAYMLANERSLRRGITLAALAALAQGLTAIAAVYGVVFVLGSAGRNAQLFAADMEIASYALITALGLWLLWRSIAPMIASRGAHHGHGHGAGHDYGGEPCCGHAHIPAPALADRPLTVATAVPIIASIGLRPCSGAIIVLIFAHTLGLYAAGVGATLAMSAGTAITVAGLASLAVGSRDLAGRLVGATSRRVTAFYRLVAISGALVVFVLGVLLLHAALTLPAKPFM